MGVASIAPRFQSREKISGRRAVDRAFSATCAAREKKTRSGRQRRPLRGEPMSTNSRHTNFRSLLVACGVLLAAACASSTPPRTTTAPAEKGSETATRLIAEIDAWDKSVVVGPAAPGHGLGTTEMSVEGRSVWPPTGPSCAELVACCEAFDSHQTQ